MFLQLPLIENSFFTETGNIQTELFILYLGLLILLDIVLSKLFTNPYKLKGENNLETFKRLSRFCKALTLLYVIYMTIIILGSHEPTSSPLTNGIYKIVILVLILNRSAFLMIKSDVLMNAINGISIIPRAHPQMLDNIFAVDFFTLNLRSVRKRVLIRSCTTATYTWIFLVLFFDCLPKAFELKSLFISNMDDKSLAWAYSKPTFFFYYPIIFGALYWKYDQRYGKQWQTLTDIFYRKEVNRQELLVDIVNMELWSNKAYKTVIEYWLSKACHKISGKTDVTTPRSVKLEYNKEYYIPNERSPWELSRSITEEIESRKAKRKPSRPIMLTVDELLEIFRLHSDLESHHVNHFRIAERAMIRQ